MSPSAPAVLGRLRARTLRLAELVATPLVPADYIDLFDPLRSGADLRGRLVAVRPETRDSATLVIRPGRGWLPHVPGQYVRIGVDVDGVRLWRAYSVTSPLDEPGGHITVTVKAIPGGVVSNHLVHHARPGTVLQLDQATGEFVLPTTAPTKILFITAGSGITPVMGMLRNAVHELDDVVLVHSAPTEADVIFRREIRALAATGRIRLVEKHTDRDGMVDVDELARLVPDLAERESWACGPTGMLDVLEQHFADQGLADRLHTERFRPAVFVTGEGGSVTFDRTDTTVEADGATPILDAGEAAGVLMPSGCRMGICFGCVVPLRSGAVRDLRDGAVTTAAEGDGVLVQTCISAAAGPCHIDV
ncbi:MAG: stearoyl-CoA 9-desaturase oxidoreductase [Frankiaceae bacterium]|nr:stearoyl-CoA 9-desaturase oxidoreductase [Frankiaceae bacterium]